MTIEIKKAGFPLGETPPEQQNVERIPEQIAGSVQGNCNAQTSRENSHNGFNGGYWEIAGRADCIAVVIMPRIQ
jgi:hypothetical protein